MYHLLVKESLDVKFKKLEKHDKALLQLIASKVDEILENPHRFKPLRKPLANHRRVHVGGCFVLVYTLNEAEKTVTLLDFDHHDKIYQL